MVKKPKSHLGIQHVENGLADQPQEAVNAGPELADVAQGLSAVIEEIDAVDAVAEAQNQTACDDGRDQRGEDLSQHTHDLLQRVLVLLGRALDSLLGDTVDAGDRDEIIVEIVDRVADDDLELARLGESALGGFQCLDLGNVRLGGIVASWYFPMTLFSFIFLMIRQTCSYKFCLWFQYSSLVQTSQADLQKITLCLKIFSISDNRMP